MILALLQARTSSSRLPGKVLLPLAGEAMLFRQMERIRRASLIDQLIVATSDRADDDPIAEIAARAAVGCHRGSLGNVLDRFHGAAAPLQPGNVVRLTGDCPLVDWKVIDGCIRFAVEGGFDYASNSLNPTWPDGLDVEVMTFEALQTAWREANTPLETEHVTPFLYRQPDRFNLGSFENDTDLSEMRWTVDEPQDYEFVRQVYEALYPADPAFDTSDILALLSRRPELRRINMGIQRNEGLAKSGEIE